MKHLRTFIGTLAAVLLIGIVPAAAQDTGDPVVPAPAFPTNTITVAGSGSASGAPDIANLEIGVETSDPSVTVAFEQANTTIDAIIDALVEAGVAREDIRTVGLNIFQDRFPMPMDPMTSTMNPENVQPVYRVNNQVRVTVRDIANVAAVINAAVEAGANNIYGLNFGIDDRDALENDARADALADAQARAQQYADLIGAELGEVVVVNEGFGGSGPFDVFNFSIARDQTGGGAVVEPGQLSVTVQVQVTYRINR